MAQGDDSSLVSNSDFVMAHEDVSTELRTCAHRMEGCLKGAQDMLQAKQFEVILELLKSIAPKKEEKRPKVLSEVFYYSLQKTSEVISSGAFACFYAAADMATRAAIFTFVFATISEMCIAGAGTFFLSTTFYLTKAVAIGGHAALSGAIHGLLAPNVAAAATVAPMGLAAYCSYIPCFSLL